MFLFCVGFVFIYVFAVQLYSCNILNKCYVKLTSFVDNFIVVIHQCSRLAEKTRLSSELLFAHEKLHFSHSLSTILSARIM